MNFESIRIQFPQLLLEKTLVHNLMAFFCLKGLFCLMLLTHSNVSKTKIAYQPLERELENRKLIIWAKSCGVVN